MTARTAQKDGRWTQSAVRDYTRFHLLVLLVVQVSTSTQVHAAFDVRLRAPAWCSIPRRQRPLVLKHNGFPSLPSFETTLYSSCNDDNDLPLSSSVNFALDPESDLARHITSQLGLSDETHDKLSRLAFLVVEWNEKINLVSRKDCRVDVVFGRHILPSLALVNVMDDLQGAKIVDVGTGGGFPGLPLAIAFSEADFWLVDSVGKKLKAVQSMADELQLTNVRVHHGRAEEMVDEDEQHGGSYDICVGRSVAALPKFCFWIDELLKPPTDDQDGGKLFYIIGGDIEDELLSQSSQDVAIDALLQQEGVSDKRILVFDQNAVANIAAASGEVKRKRGRRPGQRKSRSKKKAASSRGQWTKRDNSKPKQRGYENFKRYG